MAGINFDVAGARQAGYSDAEIVQHMAGLKDNSFDVNGALKAGYTPTEILQHVAPQPSGIIDSFREGAGEALGGVGETLNQYAGGAGGAGDYLKSLGEEAKPSNYTPAPIYDKQGFHASNIPAWLAKQAPGAAGVILAAGLAPEEAAVGVPIALGAGAGTLMSAGPAAKEAAVNRTGDQNAVPTTADKTRGALTSAAESAIGALPVTHFIPGAGALVDTGGAGVAQAIKRLPAAAVDQSAASAAANAAGQAGQTVGTPGGTKVDPTEVINAAAGGAVLGPTFAAKNTARQALDAAKYSAIGDNPDMQTAATQFANRIRQNADGNLEAGRFTSSKAQEVGEDAYQKSVAAVKNELGSAVNDLRSRVTLPVDADNALKSAMGGRVPSDKDYATIQAAIAGDPQAANVMNLLRQSHVADIVGDTGHHVGGKFAGGLGGAFTNILKGEHVTKTALAAVGGAAFEGGAGHIIAYSPEVLGAAALGRFMASRLDRLTDAQTPAWRFVRNFGDEGQTPVRLNVAQSQQPAAPAAGPSGPLAPLPGLPRPWSSPLATAAILAAKRAGLPPAAAPQAPLTGGPPMAGAPGTPPMIPPAVQAAMAARANLAKAPQTPAPAAPITGGPPLANAPGTPPMLPPAVQAQMVARANLAKLAAANVPAAPEAPAPVNPDKVLREQIKDATDLMAARKANAGVAGQEAAQSEIENSPFLEQKLNGSALPTPEAAKAMKTAIGSATALAKLRSDPEAEAEAAAETKAAVAAEKQKAKEAAATAKAAAKPAPAPKAPEPVHVAKTNGTTQVNDEPFPPSSYAHLPAEQAARAITKVAKDAGNVHHENGYRASVQARIAGERQAMAAIGREVPGLPLAELTARLEGAPDQKTAKAFREHLKTVYPRAAASLDQHLSDEAIGRLWKAKGPK